jgi:hypothetical protein
MVEAYGLKIVCLGIDLEMLPRLFEKFASKSCTGTGLGLFICKSIVEAHGGSIWAENNADGKGATFSFSLPMIDGEMYGETVLNHGNNEFSLITSVQDSKRLTARIR